jgi:DNA polymerase
VIPTFFGTSGPQDARIAIVGESWGLDEYKKHKPFVGQSGQELTRILADGGINRTECFLTNVAATQPTGNDMWQLFYPTAEARKLSRPLIRGLYPNDFVISELDRLREQLLFVKPDLIIGFGNYALWALTENNFSIGDEHKRKVPTGITAWRGSQIHVRDDLGGARFVPTYHPAAIMRQWAWRSTAVHDIKNRALPALDGRWKEPKYDFTIRPSFEAVQTYLYDEVFLRAEGGPLRLSWDLETRAGHVSCLGLATNDLEAICIPFMTTKPPYNYWSVEEEFAIVSLLRKVFRHPNIKLCGQNLAFDLQYAALYWCMLPPTDFDTMIAQHTCWPGTPKGLDYISSMYCKFHVYWKGEGKVWEPGVTEEDHWTYNCKDAVITWEAAEYLEKLIALLGLEEQFAEQMEFHDMAVDMMLLGVQYDNKLAPDMGMALTEAMFEYEDWFYKIIPWKLAGKGKPWWRSPIKQMQLFYEDLGQPIRRNRKTGRPTVDDEALDKIAAHEPLLKPIVDRLHEYRSASVFFSTFIQAKLDPDMRMRTLFKTTGTETYRWSSAKNAFDRGANLQNLPEGDE